MFLKGKLFWQDFHIWEIRILCFDSVYFQFHEISQIELNTILLKFAILDIEDNTKKRGKILKCFEIVKNFF